VKSLNARGLLTAAVGSCEWRGPSVDAT
jgi:hypothetical protein